MTHKKNVLRLPVLALPALVAAALAFSGPASADCGFNKGDWKAGEKIYKTTCFACHGLDGKGAVPGAPNFLKKGGPLSEPHSDMAKHIRNGFAPPGAVMAMPPRGGNPDLSDADMENVHAYLHHQFGCGK